ncbi:MAG: Nif3-like dinuclear metal center hexameric protein, partial [Prevotella sp.]|nr:Nif3-like dinuclear metal center hexameric protein [Prevotella sp.]
MAAEAGSHLGKERFNGACAHCHELLQRPIRTVAICGGAGDFVLDDAIKQKADAFITGEMHYHQYFGHEQEIQICVIGHYESEQFTTEVLRDIILRDCPEVKCYLAETITNPIKYY